MPALYLDSVDPEQVVDVTEFITNAVDAIVNYNNHNNNPLAYQIKRTRLPARCDGNNFRLIDVLSATCFNRALLSGDYSPNLTLHLVFFLPNGTTKNVTFAELVNFAQFLQEQIKNRVTCTAFNYPGVDDSEHRPKHFQQLILAGEAVVQNLINKGADPAAIILYGESLGGVVAAGVASSLHKQEQPVNVLVSRTLSRISKFACYTNNFVSRMFMSG